MGSKGFTLIEIVIAVALLAVIATLTATNIQRSIQVKAKIEKDISQYAEVRDALNIITSDVNKAFHWTDINELVKIKANNDAKVAKKPVPFPEVGQASEDGRDGPIPLDKLTQFIGKKDSLYFTSLSNVRVMRGSPVSDQAKVAYFLKGVKSLRTGEQTEALVRAISPYLDGENEEPGRETVLVEDVTDLEFKFLGEEDEEEWFDEWSGDRRSDTKFFNKFPVAVEITLETERNKRKVRLSTVAMVFMPNNETFNVEAAAPATGGNNNNNNNNANQSGTQTNTGTSN